MLKWKTLSLRQKIAAGTLLLAAAIAAVSAVRVTGAFGPESKKDEVVVWTLYFDEGPKAALDAEFGNFTDRFPAWRITHRALPYRNLAPAFKSGLQGGELPDILTLTNPAEFADSIFHAPPAPWSGDLWVLYFNHKHLTSLLGARPEAPATVAELLALFERTAKAGLRPVALGASHGWPLTSLVQHLAGAVGSPDLALDLARGTAAPEDPRLAPVLGELKRWRGLDWLPPRTNELPWTAGVGDVAAGRAAFTLLNQQFFDALPADKRADIDFFPFPADWAIGSIVYLARPAARPDRPAVREFENFLLSAGVVDRLENALALPFFGGVRDKALPARLIPSVTSSPASAYHRGLWAAAAEAVK